MEPLACQFVNLARYQQGAEGPNVDSKSHVDFSGEEIQPNVKARYPRTTKWVRVDRASVDPQKGCDPEIVIVTNESNPNFYPFNGVGIDDRSDYIRTFCENDARNRKFCTFACPNGVKMMFNGHTIPARKMKLKCRCPRVNGIKTCGWTYKRNLLTTGQDFNLPKAHFGTN